MKDYILRITAGNGSIRGFFARTTDLANESFNIHQTTPVVSAAMGRLLTATSILGIMLKSEKDLVTLTLKGDGPLKGVIATSDYSGNVKGYPYVNNVDIPLKPSGKLDVGGAIGYGTITLTRDMGLKEPYTGQIPLISGEIADDLTYYFAKSEQIPTSVALGVLVDTNYTIKQSGGFIIQLMPGTDDSFIDIIEKKLQTLKPVTEMLDKGLTPEDIAQEILGDIGIDSKETLPIKYYCNCSRERVEKAVMTLGKEEIVDILNNEKQVHIKCEFCKNEYLFNEDELKKLYKL